MAACEAGHSRILRQTESESVFLTQFLKLRYDTVRDTGVTLCEEAIHHRLEHVQLVLNREVDEVGINDHLIWRPDILVGGEKQCS